MSAKGFELFPSEAAWQTHWKNSSRRASLLSRRKHEARAWLCCVETAGYIAGSTLQSGFRLLKNGTMPLLRRNRQGWQAEILLKTLLVPSSSKIVPLTIEIHLNNRRLAEVRARYWDKKFLGSSHVMSLNLGALLGSGYISYDVASEEAAPQAAKHVLEYVLPHFERCSSPEAWLAEIDPPLDPQTTLELLLAYQGWGPACLYLNRYLDRDEQTKRIIYEEFGRLEQGKLPSTRGDLRLQIAQIASSYQLL